MTNFADHREEAFFLNNFNTDRIFSVIERTDYLFLHYIKRCEAPSRQDERVYLSTLAATMKLGIPEISKAVEKLQLKGYVSWKTDNDAGKTYVELTSKAVELMADEKRRMEQSYQKIREEIGEEELERIIRAMKKITDILKQVNSSGTSSDTGEA